MKHRAIVARWKARLRVREGLLAFARRQAAYWRRQKKRAQPGTARYSRCGYMLAQRERKVAMRKEQVAAAQRVIERHQVKARPMRLRAYDEAVKLSRVREIGGNNTGPMVEKIIRSVGGYDRAPWCGFFVAYCYQQAGSKSITSLWGRAWSLGLLAGMGKTRNPKRGHIVVYDFGAGHCGLFDRWVDKDRGIFLAREGNTRPDGSEDVSDAGGGEGVHLRTRDTSQVRHFATVLR